MKRTILMASAAVLGGLVVPAGPARAQAQQQELRYAMVSQVPTLCTIVGDVYAASGDPSSATAIAPGGAATVRVGLTVPGNQEIARVGARCNGGSATVTVDSLNGFRLRNGTGGPNREIAYSVTVAGTSVSAASVQSSYVENDISGSATRPVLIAVGAINFLLLAAGEYTDTLTLSVTPNS